MVAVDGSVCAGAWRYLCAALMLQAVRRLEGDGKTRRAYRTTKGGGCVKEHAYQLREARAWLDGGVGEITFEDCCEALSVDPGRARSAIESHCQTPLKRTRVCAKR